MPESTDADKTSGTSSPGQTDQTGAKTGTQRPVRRGRLDPATMRNLLVAVVIVVVALACGAAGYYISHHHGKHSHGRHRHHHGRHHQGAAAGDPNPRMRPRRMALVTLAESVKGAGTPLVMGRHSARCTARVLVRTIGLPGLVSGGVIDGNGVATGGGMWSWHLTQGESERVSARMFACTRLRRIAVGNTGLRGRARRCLQRQLTHAEVQQEWALMLQGAKRESSDHLNPLVDQCRKSTA